MDSLDDLRFAHTSRNSLHEGGIVRRALYIRLFCQVEALSYTCRFYASFLILVDLALNIAERSDRNTIVSETLIYAAPDMSNARAKLTLIHWIKSSKRFRSQTAMTTSSSAAVFPSESGH
jgi:hypothetical protein